MAKYRFTQHNSGLEIVDPEIQISSEGITIYPERMVIDVNILLIKEGVKYDIRLEDVAVQNMNFEVNSLHTRTLARLKDYEV